MVLRPDGDDTEEDESLWSSKFTIQQTAVEERVRLARKRHQHSQGKPEFFSTLKGDIFLVSWNGTSKPTSTHLTGSSDPPVVSAV